MDVSVDKKMKFQREMHVQPLHLQTFFNMMIECSFINSKSYPLEQSQSCDLEGFPLGKCPGLMLQQILQQISVEKNQSVGNQIAC
jgi:hypothetical protein